MTKQVVLDDYLLCQLENLEGGTVRGAAPGGVGYVVHDQVGIPKSVLVALCEAAREKCPRPAVGQRAPETADLALSQAISQPFSLR